MDKKIRFRKDLYRFFLGIDIFFGIYADTARLRILCCKRLPEFSHKKLQSPCR